MLLKDLIQKAMTIISSKPEEVAKAIDEQVGRGLTILNGHGYYSREEKTFCMSL